MNIYRYENMKRNADNTELKAKIFASEFRQIFMLVSGVSGDSLV
jgi:hypothetical protein